ncbi:hypothetical protein [Plantactinospora sp. CA-290183]|uniref:hypothetical protein n=1 Tax=Plantactinospora sp. CA-290183 TaxID=3240006 RepID=UPI003D8C9CBF
MTAITLQRGRCITCATPMTGLVRVTRRPRQQRDILERFPDPPADLNTSDRDVRWYVDPCLCPIETVEAWDAVIDAR